MAVPVAKAARFTRQALSHSHQPPSLAVQLAMAVMAVKATKSVMAAMAAVVAAAEQWVRRER
jgi:hypothetical protein